MQRPSPYLYIVGDDTDEPDPPTRGHRLTFSRPVRVMIQTALAGVAAFTLAMLITDDSALASAALAVLLAVAAGIWVAVAPSGNARITEDRTPLANVAIGTVAGGMALSLLGGLGVWDIGAFDALALCVAPLLTAVGTGVLLERTTRRPRRVLVVGTGQVARRLAASLNRARLAEVVGHVDDERLPPLANGSGPTTLGGLSDLPQIIRDSQVDVVLFTFIGTGDGDLSEAVNACRGAGAEIAVVSRLFEGLDGGLRMRRLQGYPIIAAAPRGTGRLSAFATRATDMALAGLLIVISSPLWLALAVAIRIDSRGGVLYRASRIGRGGVPFKMLKFRKMHADASGPALTLADDERFTRMGRFLARSKLDELPQLWNVLRGDMSLTGPRPEDTRFVDAHRETYETVLSVRPGITGLSQICFRREFEHLVGADFETYYVSELLPLKLAIDQYYVEHRSWATDMRILFWTAVALVRGGELDIDHLASHVAFRIGDRSRVAERAV